MVQQLTVKHDKRGSLVEVFKFPSAAVGQVLFSTTKPGMVRGNHYHTRKIEYFCVVEGSGTIRLRNRDTGESREYKVSGQAPEVVTMPIHWTHNILNTGQQDMKLLIWVSEVFDPEDPDTFFEEV